ALRAQSPALSITLTGQSMIRSDVRAHAPASVPIITSLLKGDVVFTNFEATILDARRGQPPQDSSSSGGPTTPDSRACRGCLLVAPPEALESLKTFGFNL